MILSKKYATETDVINYRNEAHKEHTSECIVVFTKNKII